MSDDIDYDNLPDEDDVAGIDEDFELPGTIDKGDEIVATTTFTAEAADLPTNTPQETLLSFLVSNHDAWTICAPIIKPEYFEEHYRPVVSHISKHVLEYKQVPSPAMIEMSTGIKLTTMPEAADPRTTKWLIDETEKFCRLQAMRNEIIRAAKQMATDKSNTTLETIYSNVKNVVEIKVRRSNIIEVHRDAEMVLKNKNQVTKEPTGWRHLDMVTGGGLPSPGMTIFAGKAGFGKTNVLFNIAVNKAEQGKTVVFITLELPTERLMPRFAASMVQMPIRQVRPRVDEVGPIMRARMHKGEGRIFVEKMKMTGTTVADLYAYLRELEIREGVKPDVLCIDYLDLMHPVTGGIKLDNTHLKDKYVCQELYDMITDKTMFPGGLQLFTASQLVKESEEKSEFDQGAMAGGTPKANTTDYLIFIRRRYEDDFCMLSISKGRDGGEGRKVPLKWNLDTLRISDDTDEKFYAANPYMDPKTLRSSGAPMQQQGTQFRRGGSLRRPVGSPEVNTDVRATVLADKALRPDAHIDEEADLGSRSG